MVNLTMLAPDIVAAILDETLPPHVTLFGLAVDPLALWEEQGGGPIGQERTGRTYRRRITQPYQDNLGLSWSVR